MPDPATDHAVAALRRFNRFHTRLAGALDERFLSTELSLAKARLVYELAQDDQLAAADLATRLDMDRGHLSRLISGLKTDGLVARTPDPANGRRFIVELTDAGRAIYARMDRMSTERMAARLAPLNQTERRQLTGAMARIERLLGDRAPEPSFLLRQPEPGDMGWVAHRHGALYAREHGWDWTFEALVCRNVADFVTNFAPDRERCWIAEHEGEIVGSAFIVRDDEETARLRMLYVEPDARGLGIGKRLAEECVRFARAKRYKRIVLWTESILTAAQGIYRNAGFELVEEKPHKSFGHDLLSQTWVKRL